MLKPAVFYVVAGYELVRQEFVKLHRAYAFQFYRARQRGISFQLSFEQWLDIWKKSGHLHERGRRRDQYVMARPGDKGPYSVANSRIVTGNKNRSEAHAGKKISQKQKLQIIKAHTGSKRSAATRRKMSQARYTWLAKNTEKINAKACGF
jgi:hypothetical protein